MNSGGSDYMREVRSYMRAESGYMREERGYMRAENGYMREFWARGGTNKRSLNTRTDSGECSVT